MATSPGGQKRTETSPLDKAKRNLEEVKQRMQNFKAEYRKNFVDINFYGM